MKICRQDFINLGMTVKISTDDGSLGQKGFVTDLLKEKLTQNKTDIIYACGPMPMLKTVAKIAENHAVPCYISVETLMACGLGACLGCAVENKTDKDKYMHVCIDGPVFDSCVVYF